MGSHMRCWVWGRRAVLETLEAGRWPMHELHLDGALPTDELERARGLAEKLGAPVHLEAAGRLMDLCHTGEHQGYLAKMAPFPYSDADAGAVAAWGKEGAALLCVVLDAIQDPHNFGAIVRTAEVMGADVVVVGEREQAEVNRLVARSSAGAVNRLPIVRVPDLADFAAELQGAGVAIVGASEQAERDCSDHDFGPPCALVFGNEGHGIRAELLALCDAKVRVPQQGVIGSLNVAASAAVVLYEAQRQRLAAAAG